MNSLLLGKKGEALAARYLRKKKYVILESNYHSRFGEIDLIAQKGQEIIFAEVKTRQSASFSEAREAVGSQKRKRLTFTALQWLAKHDPTGECQPRFDVIEVYLDPRGEHIEHLENAF